MHKYIMRVEGVNFSATMLDTQDLSCIRGASLALLHAPERIETELRQPGISELKRAFSGASQAVFSFRAEEKSANAALAAVRAMLACEGADPHVVASGKALPLAYLSFVVALVAVDDKAADSDAALADALAAAHARNRADQYRALTVRLPPFTEGAREPDALGRILPADGATIWRPQDRHSVTLLSGETEEENPSRQRAGAEIPVSRSVAARRAYGRRMRQEFYRTELNDHTKPDDKLLENYFDNWRFTDSIETICEEAPSSLPESIRNKIAVLYFDGNKFGTIVKKLSRRTGHLPPATLEKFSSSLQGLRRKLLYDILECFRSSAMHPFAWVGLNDQKHPALRFETLRWGGDEVIWVAPAWLAFWLVEAFFAFSADWTYEGHALTHGGGVAICDRKTPIRQAIAVAETLADLAKQTTVADKPVNVVQIEVFESADLPQGGELDRYRAALYPGIASEAFTLPGDTFSTIIDRFEGDCIHDEGLPRSQLYRLLEQAKEWNAFRDSGGDEKLQVELKNYLKNAGRRLGNPEELDFNFWGNAPQGWPIAHPPLAFRLALAARWWDYAAPFASVPNPPARGQTKERTTV